MSARPPIDVHEFPRRRRPPMGLMAWARLCAVSLSLAMVVVLWLWRATH